MTCILGDMADGTESAEIIYDDPECLAIAPLRVMAPTHVLLFPRAHFEMTFLVISKLSPSPQVVSCTAQLRLPRSVVCMNAATDLPGTSVPIPISASHTRIFTCWAVPCCETTWPDCVPSGRQSSPVLLRITQGSELQVLLGSVNSSFWD